MWFKLLARLEKKGVLEQFKAEIANHTIVGEYVGNYDHQHLVRYSKETIVFYAVVDNNGTTDCIGPAAAMAMFERYGLDHVSCESKGTFSTLAELRGCLKDVYVQVATDSLENEEEGLALYLATKGLPEDYTLSICKVKTLEYRIYRKIRETVKRQLSHSICILLSYTRVPHSAEDLSSDLHQELLETDQGDSELLQGRAQRVLPSPAPLRVLHACCLHRIRPGGEDGRSCGHLRPLHRLHWYFCDHTRG